MGVSFDKLKQDAPHLVDTVDLVKKVSKEKGFDPETNTATVVATFDLSISASGLYRNGDMQRVADLALAAGFAFDDDGEVPLSFFHDEAIDLGNVVPATSDGFIQRNWQKYTMQYTNYVAALDWIIGAVGLDQVDLGRQGDPLSVKFKHTSAIYALFVTDGEPNPGTGPAIEEKLIRMSQLPIFVQFVGVGPHDFKFLNKLNTLKGRLIDNAGFFDSKEITSGQPAQRGLIERASAPVSSDPKRAMLESMLSEFPSYNTKGRQIGLIG